MARVNEKRLSEIEASGRLDAIVEQVAVADELTEALAATIFDAQSSPSAPYSTASEPARDRARRVVAVFLEKLNALGYKLVRREERRESKT